MRSRNETLLCVDPSMRTCGVAVFARGRLCHHELVKPEPEARTDEYAMSWDVYHQVRRLWKKFRCDRLVLEVPTHWATSGWEARESGNFQKLVFVCGMLATVAPQEQATFYKPHEYKGQLPKKVLKNRLWQSYDGVNGIDMAKLNHNVVDAIGLGHFHLHGRV